MKNIVLVFYLFAFTSYGQTEGPKPKKSVIQEIMSTNPESIIKSLIEAMKANDSGKIRFIFDDNASQAYGDGSPKSGATFFKWLDSDIIDRKGHVENATYKTDGNQVVVTGQYNSIGYTNKANFLFSVENGKIMSWQMRY